MEWSRIKTILIWVFAVVNIFLLTIYFKEANTSKFLSDDVLNSTVEILRQNNISISKDIIPKNYENMKICSVENQYADVDGMLKNSGIDATKTIIDGNSFLYSADSLEEAQEILENLLLTDYKKEESEGLECYYLEFDNKVFFDSYLQIKNVEGKTEVKGINWLGDRVEEEGVAEIVSPAEILINFSAQYGGGQQVVIKSITAGYYVGGRTGIVRATASPVWQIMTEDGQEFYYDMRNGDLL